MKSAARLLAPLACSLLLLSACGGGGGGGDASTPPPSTRFGPSSSYAGICTVEGQKQFVRSYLDEMYLWYREIPEVDPARYTSVTDYFYALLVTTPDAAGLPKDRFSAVLPASLAQSMRERAFAPADPAGDAGLLKNHTDAVPVAKVVTSPRGRRTGYIQFNDHEQGSQDDLITAFRQIRDAGVQDLVLDLRYNSGGFLYVALTAASMVVGPAAEGKVFETLRYNDKRDAESASGTLYFSSQVQYGETQYPRGTALPQLGLQRLYVLTSSQTCSASESIINDLRGIDVEVIQIGGTTCGKPYGFSRKDNCGLAYFPVEFQGQNAKGFGDYTSGLRATCNVADNPAVTAGSSGDPLLNAALSHMDSGQCPAGTQAALRSGAPVADGKAPGRPAWLGRLLAPER